MEPEFPLRRGYRRVFEKIMYKKQRTRLLPPGSPGIENLFLDYV
jgi:hypothetical protein